MHTNTRWMLLAAGVVMVSVTARADDLLPLELSLGIDAGAVEKAGIAIRYSPTVKKERQAVRSGVAFHKVGGKFWQEAVLAFSDGRLVSIAYSSPSQSTSNQKTVLQVYGMLLARYGEPTQVLACKQPIKGGFCDSPLMVWRRQDQDITFYYTPFTTDEAQQVVGLQVMLPEVRLERRYKVVDANSDAIEALTRDVADIKVPKIVELIEKAPSPEAASDLDAVSEPVLPSSDRVQKPIPERGAWYAPWLIVCCASLGILLVSKGRRK